jgi:hypothetical protein
MAEVEMVNCWQDKSFRTEYMKNYCKQYYIKNKEYLLENVDCEHCGRTVVKASLLRHQQSKYCQVHAERRKRKLDQS